MKKVCCTIGILTYNSEAHLKRALESVKDFAQIIVADGGSTDQTLEIARQYGAHIIEQSNPGHAIEDFALERNRTLEAATTPWFFYLDSDEIVSEELRTAIGEITSSDVPFDAYRVRYLKTTADGSRPYRTLKEYYQIRLFRTDRGASFVRTVHERVELPAGARVGQVEAPWYVPLEPEDLSWSAFGKKAWKRTGGTAAAWQPKGLFNGLYLIVWYPLVEFMKALMRMVLVRLKWGSKAIPAKYELLRMLYALMLSVQHARRLF